MAQVGDDKYKLVFSTNLEAFVEQCNEAVKAGYTPIGGPLKPNSKEFMQGFYKQRTGGSNIGRPKKVQSTESV